MLFAVYPVHPLRAGFASAAFQQRAQTPVTVARLLLRHGDQLAAQLGVVVRPRLISVGGPIHGHELAGFPFRVRKFAHHERHILPWAYKLQPFFRITAFSASLSRLRSATMCFRRRFSSSSSFSRRPSLPSMPPYLLFQV